MVRRQPPTKSQQFGPSTDPELMVMSLQKKLQPKESRLGRFSKSVDIGITDIVPTPDNYGPFVDLVKNASRHNILRGCHTSYSCGLTDETKELYKGYKMQFKDDPFNSATTETGNRLCDEIADAQQKKWQT